MCCRQSYYGMRGDMTKAKEKRRSARSRVTNLDLKINNRPYKVFNINEHGVGIVVNRPGELAIGEEIVCLHEFCYS